MKIRELFENLDLGRKDDKEHQFDVADDLFFFMHNNDNFYRKHYYPRMLQAKKSVKSGLGVDPTDFTELVKTAYECYLDEFNDITIPEASDDIINTVCEKICSEELVNIENNLY